MAILQKCPQMKKEETHYTVPRNHQILAVWTKPDTFCFSPNILLKKRGKPLIRRKLSSLNVSFTFIKGNEIVQDQRDQNFRDHRLCCFYWFCYSVAYFGNVLTKSIATNKKSVTHQRCKSRVVNMWMDNVTLTFDLQTSISIGFLLSPPGMCVPRFI